jgi:hypothetical protein
VALKFRAPARRDRAARLLEDSKEHSMSSIFAQRTGRSLIALAVVVALGTTLARADLVQVRAAPSGAPLTYYLPATEAQLSGAYDGGAFGPLHTGTFNLEEDRGSGWTPLLTYCSEADVGIGFDTNPPDTVGLTYNEIAVTADPDYTAQEQAVIDVLWANAFTMSTSNFTDAAAFQALIWELGQDNNFDLLSGNFQLDTSDAFTATVASQVNTWYGLIQNHTWTASHPLELLDHADSQDLFHVVPEPASLVLALGGLAVAARRGSA